MCVFEVVLIECGCFDDEKMCVFVCVVCVSVFDDVKGSVVDVCGGVVVLMGVVRVVMRDDWMVMCVVVMYELLVEESESECECECEEDDRAKRRATK